MIDVVCRLPDRRPGPSVALIEEQRRRRATAGPCADSEGASPRCPLAPRSPTGFLTTQRIGRSERKPDDQRSSSFAVCSISRTEPSFTKVSCADRSDSFRSDPKSSVSPSSSREYAASHTAPKLPPGGPRGGRPRMATSRGHPGLPRDGPPQSVPEQPPNHPARRRCHKAARGERI
jgi:hypothetical protein